MKDAQETARRHLTSFDDIQHWLASSPEHAKAMLKAFDAELAREHELRMLQERAKADKERRGHVLFMTSVIAGFVIIVGALGGAVVLGMQGRVALPSMIVTACISMATVFVLRRHDPKQIRAVVEAQAKMARSRLTREPSTSADQLFTSDLPAPVDTPASSTRLQVMPNTTASE